MGGEVLTVGEAWKIYDRWLEDSRIVFRPDPPELNAIFRAATRPVSRLASPKAIGDCYLLAVSQALEAALVTLDAGLATAARKAGHPVALLE